jgi:Copper type II ascorbate-dependent monooxygenase, C-terminal domain/DOMON domain/Copper type II ascorbate-dependent monooxygenase, N-terminal domain
MMIIRQSYQWSIIGLFFSLLCGLSCAQVPFDGVVDRQPYLDWLKSVSYTRSTFLPGTVTGTGAAIHWSIVGKEIRLGVAVRATGWAAFGFSENGGMRGADIVIYNAKADQIMDAHVLEDLLPLEDVCQDWKLKKSQSQNGFLIFEASRLLDTGDKQDRPLLNDTTTKSDTGTPPNRIIAAWGDQPSYAYHGPNRARGSVRFFEKSGGNEWENFRKQMVVDADGSFDLMAVNFKIPPQVTTYQDFCFFESDLIASGMPAGVPLHNIGVEPVISTPTASNVHHFTVYGAINPNDCNSQELAYAWAPGDLPLILPPNVGGPLGTGGGFRAFRLVIHYNNPTLNASLVDNSGIRIFYTSKKRQFDLGMFVVGDPIVNLRGQEIGQGRTVHNFTCRPECSATFLDGPITVIVESLHMHISGRRMVNSQTRNNKTIRSGSADFFDFSQQGSQSVVQQPFVFQPGDGFKTSCYYESSGNKKFGLGSDEEMCTAFMLYYPRKLIFNLIPLICGYNVPLGVCKSSWTHESLTSVDELHRTFGPSPALLLSS